MTGDDRGRLLRLLLTHYEELTGYLTRRLGSAGEARDVVHDTYLRLQRVESVPDVRNPRAYLYRVADNIALDRLRAEGRRRGRFVAAELGEDRPSAAPSAEEVLTQRQRVRLLSDAIDELSPRQREVFLMHKFDGLSHTEISRRLGITRSMVEKHVMRALAHCRDRMKA